MKSKIHGFRSSILSFVDNPLHLDKSYKYYQDGIIYVEDGIIKDVGDYSDLSLKYRNVEVTNYIGKLIIPGFIDTHIHYPQLEMIASYGENLLGWLDKYTFPVEKKYSNFKYAQVKAGKFLESLINNGVTSAAIYATSFSSSVDAIFSEAYKRNMRVISGKVLMNRNAPDYLIDTPENDYSESIKLIEKWHNKNRLLYAITPRFAITSSDLGLEVCKKLIDEYPGLYLQTHLSENNDEIEYVKRLYPQATSYLDVYDYYGLVRKNSIFGHSIYLDDKDFKLLSEKEASIAFCPSSNLFLGSGLFNLPLAEKYKINIGLGSDIGAGTSLSPFQTMAEAYKVIQLGQVYNNSSFDISSITPLSYLYYSTLGAAKTIGVDDYVGSFDIGKEADFLVINTDKPDILQQKVENDKSLEEMLFSVMILGNDTTIEQVYIMGSSVK